MIVIPIGVKVHLALGPTDMRKGLDRLATLFQGQRKNDPFSGHLFVFRGKNASLLKILFWDGTALPYCVSLVPEEPLGRKCKEIPSSLFCL
jgi:transposase